MRRSVIVTVSLCLYVPGVVAMQDARPAPSPAAARPSSPQPSASPSTPPRDTSAPVNAAGVAAIFGRVTAAGAGTPLRGAIVTAWPRGGSGGGRVAVSARVGDDGRYRIEGVVPGEYGLMASHPMYLRQALGQTTPRTPERSLLVTGGAVAGPLDFAMLRGAAISGRVVDESGEPVERIPVRASKLRRFASRLELVPHGEAVITNDLGEYRLHGLPPGEYVVGADPPRHPLPGNHAVTADSSDLVPSWAPGTHSPADADRVRLEAGGEAQADIQLAFAAVASISGRAVGSGGQAITDAIVRLHARGGILGITAGHTSVNGDGSFRFDGVVPGSYTVVVSPRRSTAIDSQTGLPLATEIGSLDVDVAGGMVTKLTVRTDPGTTIRGRLVVDGDPTLLAGRVPFVVAAATDRTIVNQIPARARVGPDLSFELHGARGRVQLRLNGVPDGWWTRTVRRGGSDVTDGLDTVDATAIDGVEVVVSTRPTAVRGTVKHATGADVDAVVLLFTQDERRWEDSVTAAGTTLVRPIEDGSFRSPTMRPGSYYVIALGTTEVKSDDLGDPDYLRELALRATLIDVAEGQVPELALIVP